MGGTFLHSKRRLPPFPIFLTPIKQAIMMVLLQAVVTLCIIAILLARIWSISHPRPSSRLPPGPRGDPIIGHVRMVPASQPWVTYMDWARKYSKAIPNFQTS